VITGINHVTFAVVDLERSLRFYADVLGCRLVAKWKRGAYLAAGELWVCLSVDEPARSPAAADSSHVALSVSEADFPTLRERILAANAPQWQPNRSEGPSLYFLDPDGHRLEIHVGDLQSRLAACRKAPYEEMELFE